MTATLYDDLGVPPTATADEIKAAGKRMAKQHHPDRGGNPSVFDRARKALTVLSDPRKREEYDRTGRAEFSSDPEADELRDAGQLVMQGMIAVLQGGANRSHPLDASSGAAPLMDPTYMNPSARRGCWASTC